MTIFSTGGKTDPCSVADLIKITAGSVTLKKEKSKPVDKVLKFKNEKKEWEGQFAVILPNFCSIL